MNLSEQFANLKGKFTEAEEELMKFYDKNNKAAGTRARKALLDIRNLAQEIRLGIQELKNSGGK
ncbi:MAG: histone H1 [Solitalea-like symbiont of Acarus siro]